MSSKVIRITSPAGTAKVARELATKLAARLPGKGALVIALEGELGTGKTTFTKAFLKTLGVRESVTSPTFILFRPYVLPSTHLRATSYALAYHLDCYRLEDPKELLKLGLKEMIANPKHIVIIEWAERVKKFLPKSAIWIQIAHGTKKSERKVSFSASDKYLQKY